MKEYLTKEQLKEELNVLNDYASDFVNDGPSGYIGDAMGEFADSRTSIYYSEQKKYLMEHMDEVEDVINEYGWDGVDRSLYKAAAYAEYDSIYNELAKEEDEIKENYAIQYIIDNDFKVTKESLELIKDDIKNSQRFEDIIHAIELFEDNEDEQAD